MNDEEAIRQLLARFIQLRDDKRFSEWVELFEPDGAFTYSTRVLIGRVDIETDVATLLRHDRGKHLCINSVIDVSGDTAAVVSDFVKLRHPDTAAGKSPIEVQVMGRYYDVLGRSGGTWRIRRRDVVLYGDPPPPTSEPGAC